MSEGRLELARVFKILILLQRKYEAVRLATLYAWMEKEPVAWRKKRNRTRKKRIRTELKNRVVTK